MIRYVASLDPQVTAEMGRKARSYMEANKTWDAQGRRVVRFIRDMVMKENGGPTPTFSG